MKEGKIDILIVEDHAIVLHGIESILKEVEEINTITAAASGMIARKMMAKGGFDYYILDIELPDVSGFELVEEIKDRHPAAHVIVHTMHEEVWTVKRLLQNEVDAIVFKSGDATELKQAIRSLLNGVPYYSANFKYIHRKLHEHTLAGGTLSVRELEVLRHIADGKSTFQIAEHLSLSANTIETYRKRLMSKLNASNMVDLIMKAISLGIIPMKGMRN